MITLKGLSSKDIAQLFPHHPILVGYRGSIAHGMYLPNTDPNSVDDKDVLAVTVGPPDRYLGLNRFEGVERQIGEWDVVNYELLKFVRLLLKSNPNVLSLLWLAEQHYIYRSDSGRNLISYRDTFVSKHIYHSFTGYAHGQLRRMTHHEYLGYMGAKRKALVDKYGYDCKNAAHLIRLLRMGIEFLNEGNLHVLREDAPQLLEIKTGQWTLQQVKDEAQRLFRRAEDAYDRSTLPNAPDRDAANNLVWSILEDHLGGRG
jgi:predicted nucleotidyltransferase